MLWHTSSHTYIAVVGTAHVTVPGHDPAAADSIAVTAVNRLAKPRVGDHPADECDAPIAAICPRGKLMKVSRCRRSPAKAQHDIASLEQGRSSSDRDVLVQLHSARFDGHHMNAEGCESHRRPAESSGAMATLVLVMLSDTVRPHRPKPTVAAFPGFLMRIRIHIQAGTTDSGS
jgi:hypothetical protein